MFGVSELSHAGVFEFCVPYDGVLVAEETLPSLADHTAPYEVLEGCVQDLVPVGVMRKNCSGSAISIIQKPDKAIIYLGKPILKFCLLSQDTIISLLYYSTRLALVATVLSTQYKNEAIHIEQQTGRGTNSVKK